MWEVKPYKRQRHMIIELDNPLLETNEAILFLKLTIGVCGSKQEKALKWEPHDKIEYTLLVNGSRFRKLYVRNNHKWHPTYLIEVMCEVEPRERQRHMIIELDYPLLETNEAILFLNLRSVCVGVRSSILCWKMVVDSASYTLELPTNGIPTSRVMCELEPRKRQSHMIIELDYPLLETNEGILFLKLTIGVCGSKQEEALKWEPHDMVVVDTDDHHIVREAPRYQIMSFMVSSILSWKMEVDSASYTLEIPTNGIPTSKVMWEVEPRERRRHMIIELDYPLLETNEAILFLKLTIGVCGTTNGIPTSRVMWEVEPRERQRHMIIELDYPLLETNEAILFLKLTIGVCESKRHLNGSRMTRW
nr:hypothetical protein [Tanacetum cinerariifolium]